MSHNVFRSWFFEGREFFGCTDEIRSYPNISLYLKDELCKKFYENNPSYWAASDGTLKKSSITHKTPISQVEIFKLNQTQQEHVKANSKIWHLATCYNPTILTSNTESSLSPKWCATAQSYTEILEEKEVIEPADIGICPGRI